MPYPELQTPLWAYLDVSHRDRILQVRDILYNSVGNGSYIPENDPHITLHRGFQIPHSNLDDLLDIISSSPLEGRQATVTGIKLWPSIDEPHVVMLDVDIDLEPTKTALDDAIKNHDGTAFHDPVPPHITLFQTGLHQQKPHYDVFTPDECDRLFALKNAFEFPWELTITDISFGRYDRQTPE